MSFYTGSAPPGFTGSSGKSDGDNIVDWFIRPIERMGGNDAFACLTLCFPLIEAIIRLETKVPDDQAVSFSDNSAALHWFAGFLTIPEAEARKVWDGLRNGLLHRAMIHGDLEYELSGDHPGRPAQLVEGRLCLYVWEIKERVIGLVRKHGRALWRGTSSPLPRVYSKL